MIRVLLVSMPYTILSMPSIAIAQLKAVAKESMREEVKVDSAHCFIDFAEFIGMNNYKQLGIFANKGLHDWMFREAAFQVQDNLVSYEQFFFSDRRFPKKIQIFQTIIEMRVKIGEFLDGLIADYHMTDYDVVGFTSMMSQSISSFALANRIKQARANIVTVMGGPNCEYPMGKTIADNIPYIDYVFSGEGLVSFPQFLKALSASNYEAIASIRGIHSQRNDLNDRAVGADSVIGFYKTPAVSADVKVSVSDNALKANTTDGTFNMNDLPMLDYSEYIEKVNRSPLRKHLKGELLMPFQTSTGCWKADKIPCSFCGLTPHPFRQMDSAHAKAYINELIDRYADDFFMFEATDPCMPVEYPREVFPYINQDKCAVLQYECRANIPIDDLKHMAAANMVLPQPGIESLSTNTLKLMRKGITAFQNVQFLKACVEEGLYPIWNHLFGLPDKAYNDLDNKKVINDIQTLYHMPPPTSNIPISFQRYSEYYKNTKKYGLNLKPLDYYSYVYPFNAEIINNLAYTYMDVAFSEKLSTKYAENIQAINIEIVIWMSKFRKTIPKLYFKDQLVIYDSRNDKAVEYILNKIEKDVMLFMNKPRTIEDVSEHFSISLEKTKTLIDGFLKKRFLFTERGKYLNIVCKQCHLKSDVYQKYYIEFVRNSSIGFE